MESHRIGPGPVTWPTARKWVLSGKHQPGIGHLRDGELGYHQGIPVYLAVVHLAVHEDHERRYATGADGQRAQDQVRGLAQRGL